MNISKEKVNILLARNSINVKMLAEKCNISRTRICTILNSRNVKPQTVGKIAAALGVDVTEIIE